MNDKRIEAIRARAVRCRDRRQCQCCATTLEALKEVIYLRTELAKLKDGVEK